MNWLLGSGNGVQLVASDNQRVSFRMLQTVDFQINIKIRPFDGFASAHTDIQDTPYGSILHPWNAVVGQEIIVTKDTDHDALGINHQHVYQCVV